MWGVEVEVGQSQGAKEQAWEPVDLVHARVDQRGLVKSFVSNRDLLARIGREVEGGGFKTKEVFPGSRTNTVQAGRRRTDNTYTLVYLSVATGGTRTMQLEINPTLSDRDVASITGRGTTVAVTQKDITAKYGTNLPVVYEEGTIVAGLQIGNESWQIWGAYNLVEPREDNLVVRSVQAVRKGAVAWLAELLAMKTLYVSGVTTAIDRSVHLFSPHGTRHRWTAYLSGSSLFATGSLANPSPKVRTSPSTCQRRVVSEMPAASSSTLQMWVPTLMTVPVPRISPCMMKPLARWKGLWRRPRLPLTRRLRSPRMD